jgi:hypothetical protein
MTFPFGLMNECGADQRILSMTDELPASIEGISPTSFYSATLPAATPRKLAAVVLDRSYNNFQPGPEADQIVQIVGCELLW